jgi:hypothetical protein
VLRRTGGPRNAFRALPGHHTVDVDRNDAGHGDDNRGVRPARTSSAHGGRYTAAAAAADVYSGVHCPQGSSIRLRLLLLSS